MAMNIKNPEVERLAAELAKITGESKTEVVRRALLERKETMAHQIAHHEKGVRFLRYLAEEIWPLIPPAELGHPPSKSEREEILGYGPEGV